MVVVALGLAATGCSGSGGGTGALLAPGANARLIDVQAQVFSPRCALSGCHTGTGAQLGLNLSSGSTAATAVGVSSVEVPGLLRVDPYNATDSYLYMKITGDPRIEGDPMPQAGTPLNAADLALVRDWIDQGAL